MAARVASEGRPLTTRAHAHAHAGARRIQQFLVFTSRLLVQRASVGVRETTVAKGGPSALHNRRRRKPPQRPPPPTLFPSPPLSHPADYYAHYYRQESGMASIMMTDMEYPKRVAFAVQKELTDQFIAMHGDKFSNK